MQLHQVAVLQLTGQIFLNGLAAAVDQAQLLLVHRGRAVEQLVDEPHFLAGREPLDPAGGKIPDNGGIGRADRDDQLLRQQNTKRDRGVDALAGTLDLDGDVNDDDGVAVLQTDARRLLRVGRSYDVGCLNVQCGRHPAHLIVRGTGQTDPGPLAHIIDPRQLLILCAVNLHHGSFHPYIIIISV